MGVSADELAGPMSQRLANFRLDDDAIRSLADRVVIDGLEIARFDPCIYGICVDYWTREMPQVQLESKRRISKWEVHPYGIIDWDMFRVRIAFEVDELEGRVSGRGFLG